MVEPIAPSILTRQQNAAEMNIQVSAAADFRVEKKDRRNWRISLLSARARHWFEANLAKNHAARSACVIETNLAGANDFIHKARTDGFRTEYIGPIGKSYF